MERYVFGPPMWIEWCDIRWHRNRGGFYRDRDSGYLLHFTVYLTACGELEPGDDVRHWDGDRANNHPSNLVRVPGGRRARGRVRRALART